jgi:hypothetical protein
MELGRSTPISAACSSIDYTVRVLPVACSVEDIPASPLVLVPAARMSAARRPPSILRKRLPGDRGSVGSMAGRAGVGTTSGILRNTSTMGDAAHSNGSCL